MVDYVQGKVEREREWQCLAKTEARRYSEVEAAIRSVHSYDEPEIIATRSWPAAPATSPGSARTSAPDRGCGYARSL